MPSGSRAEDPDGTEYYHRNNGVNI
jgi:hypothetical protein